MMTPAGQQKKTSSFVVWSRHTMVDVQTHWNLRFCDNALEQRYLAYIVQRDNLMSRLFVSLALMVIITTLPLNLKQLPAGADSSQLFIRLAAFIPFWAGCIYLFNQSRFAKKMPWMMLLCTMYGTAVLNYGQWLFWDLGSTQSMLGVVMVAPMLGCMPWRLGTFASIWAALVLIVPELLFQNSEVHRNTHITYIIMSAMIGSITAYVQEYYSRMQFLINNRYRQQSRHDQLTGLPNRRELDVVLPRLLAQAARDRVRFVVAMLDVDYFKKYNDYYGHAEGDVVLATVAQTLSEKSSPQPDFVARYGGEEFVAVWINPRADALTLGEGLRYAIEELNMPHLCGRNGRISVSVGITWMDRGHEQHNMQSLLARADHALYLAKNKGRNQVRAEMMPVTPEDVIEQDDILHTSDWQSGQAEEEQNPDLQTERLRISPADYRRWYFGRGLMERQQIRWKARLAIATVITQILIVYLAVPHQYAFIPLMILSCFSLPALLAAYFALRSRWITHHLQSIAWSLVLPHTGSMIYILYTLQQHGISFAYDFLLIIVFQTYFFGVTTWRIASSSSIVVCLFYMVTVYNLGGMQQVMETIIPFIIANAIGMVTAYTQDRRSRDIFFKKEQLEKLASRDPLTGLANRHGLESYVLQLLPTIYDAKQVFTVAMVDIDHFKKYNDFYGHHAGDNILARIAQVLARHGRRPYDLAVRLGGEEFALIWYNDNEVDMLAAGEQICQQIYNLQIPHEKSEYGVVTVCIGIAQGVFTSKVTMADIETLLKQADDALYAAKKAGRNRAVRAENHSYVGEPLSITP